MASILIVDDDPVIRDALSEALGQEHSCHTAPTAEQGLGLLESLRFDAVIVDISLPGMSGLELMGHILQRWPGTPVIIITGIDSYQYTSELIRMGAFDYLAKPFRLQNAEGSVARAILYHDRWLEAVKESTDRALKSGKQAPEESSTWMLERRRAARHRAQRAARLLFTLRMSDAGTTAGGSQPRPALIGYTRDISLTGLSLVVPGVRDSDREFYGTYDTLRITLSLPTGNVEVQAAPVRYQWLDESDPGKGYLIGAQITGMDDRGQFDQYLGTIG